MRVWRRRVAAADAKKAESASEVIVRMPIFMGSEAWCLMGFTTPLKVIVYEPY
jgi:hypothetical protein